MLILLRVMGLIIYYKIDKLLKSELCIYTSTMTTRFIQGAMSRYYTGEIARAPFRAPSAWAYRTYGYNINKFSPSLVRMTYCVPFKNKEAKIIISHSDYKKLLKIDEPKIF
jgi:hypothetical protein